MQGPLFHRIIKRQRQSFCVGKDTTANASQFLQAFISGQRNENVAIC